MRIKGDFVTNSSTTSFVAWGIRIDIDELREKHGEEIYKSQNVPNLKASIDNIVNISKVSDIDDSQNRDDFFDDFSENIREIIEDAGLDTAKYAYDDELMIGNCPSSMNDDETLSQFKTKICEKFKSVGIDIKPEELGWIEEAWRDG